MRSDSQADFSARRQEWLNGEKARYSRDNNPRYRSKYADLPSSEKDPFGDADEAQTSRYRQMLQSAQPVQSAQEPQSWQEAQRSWRQERQQEQRQWEQQQAQQQREQQQWEQQWERQWEQPQAGQQQRRQQRPYAEDQPDEARQRSYADDQERERRYPQEESRQRSRQQDLDQYAYGQDLDQQRPDRQDQQRTRRQSQQQDQRRARRQPRQQDRGEDRGEDRQQRRSRQRRRPSRQDQQDQARRRPIPEDQRDQQRARRQPRQQDRGEDRQQRRSREQRRPYPEYRDQYQDQRRRPYPEGQVQEQPPRQRSYPEEQIQERPYPEEQIQERPYPEEQIQERPYQPEQIREQPRQQRPYPEGQGQQRSARQRQDQRQRRTYQQDRQQSQRRQQYARQQERQPRSRSYSPQQQRRRQQQRQQQQQRYSRESYTQRQPRPSQQGQSRYARQSYARSRRGQPQVQPVRQVQPVPVPQGDYVTSYPRSRYDYGRGTAAGRHISIPKKKRSRRRIVIPIIAIAVLLVLVGGAFAYAHSLPITVTLNDEEFELTGWHKTIGAVIDESGLDPKPGDLVAVDGSVLEAGQGEPFEATINDKVTSNSSAGVRSRDVIEINDGDPIEEPADVVEKPVDYEVEIEGTGAIHLMEGTGKDGVKEVKTGQISGLTSEEVTQEPDNVVCHEVSPDVGDDKVIALTFDDGPSEEYTSEILDVLKANDAKATFFTIGTCIDDNDDGVSLVKRAAAAGNQICTHTYDHAAGDGQGTNLSFMTDTEQVEEVEKGFRCIDSALGYDVPRIMRAPGGNLTEDVVANVHSLVEADIGWNIDTEDWTQPGVTAIMEQIKSASPGDIVLMHDGGGDRSQTVEALQNALPILKSKGYTFVTIDELMEYDMS